MALQQEIKIRRQASRFATSINEAIANCKAAITSDESTVFASQLERAKKEAIATLRLLQELEAVTAELVNGEE